MNGRVKTLSLASLDVLANACKDWFLTKQAKEKKQFSARSTKSSVFTKDSANDLLQAALGGMTPARGGSGGAGTPKTEGSMARTAQSSTPQSSGGAAGTFATRQD